MKTYSEEDMKAAYEAGSNNTEVYDGSRGEEFNYLCIGFKSWIESYNTPPKPEEEELSFPWWLVKEKCGWSRWCDVTEDNHYALNERGEPERDQLFHCTESQARKLGLI